MDGEIITIAEKGQVQAQSDFKPVSDLVRHVIAAFTRKETIHSDEKRITVNPVVSKFASWYEKLRNAMEYRDEEVILRATIERILKRRLLLGGTGRTTAEPLVRELLWARYLPENEAPESIIKKVEESIDLFLALRLKIVAKHKLPEYTMNQWTYHLMSADLQHILSPNREKEAVSNLMFQILKDDITIIDDTEETKNAQVFISVRRAFDRDDVAFLRYNLFLQYFGRLTHQNIDRVAENFLSGYKEFMKELEYAGKERIYTYIKRRTAVFYILEDILLNNRDNIEWLLENGAELEKAVTAACDVRYHSIASRVRRAIIRSVVFILLTKVAFAFLIEGTYDKLVYGKVIWASMALNISIPPVLMIIVSLFFRTPGADNTEKIYKFIDQVLFEENPRLGPKLTVYKKRKAHKFDQVFNVLWWLAFILSFGGVIYILGRLHFNLVSQFIFVFFLAIVSFLSYRISLISTLYRVGETQGILTPLIDFLFMPVIRVGRRLTQTVAQINFFIFIFDMFIETPFKQLFAFFEQWFYYLHSKSEELE